VQGALECLADLGWLRPEAVTARPAWAATMIASTAVW